MSLIRPASFALLFVWAVSMVSCDGSWREEYLKQNDAVLQQAPVFQGASEVSRTVGPYYREDFAFKPDGYMTVATFSVPIGTTSSQVLEFFANWPLPNDWRRRVQGSYVFFCVGDSEVRVETANVDEPGSKAYQVFADQRGQLHGGSGCHF